MFQRLTIGTRRSRPSTIAAAALALMLGIEHAPTARAQNALGDGRALDANPLVGSGGRNTQVRNIEAELKFRNAIVTGNAAGGFAFRDFVGYSAAGDFTGELGSDDIFAFERDSLFSGLASRNVRGIDALQQMMALSTGGLPDLRTATVTVERPGRGAMGADLFGAPDGLQDVDAYTARPRTMRSTSEYLVSTQTESTPFSAGMTQAGQPMLFSSSPLRGVFVEPYPGYGVPTVPSPDLATAPSTTQTDDRASTRIPPIRSTYEQILREFSAVPRVPPTDAAPAAPPEGAPAAEPEPEPEAVLDETFMARVDRLRRELLQMGVEPRPEEEPFRVADEAARLFGGTTPLIERFADKEAVAQGAYDRHIAEGQRLLGLGLWFDAEEAFTRALLRREGDPIASVGRVHAQLGAGMPLSAAVSLRALFRAHPELIAVRYGEQLLPREPRKSHILEMLRNEASRNDGFGRDAAFLLAYLGHQYNSRDEVRAGFDAIARIDTYLAADQDALIEALRAVWLKGD